MQSLAEPLASPPPFDADAPTMAEGAEAWSQLSETLNELARLQARVVTLAGRVVRSGTIERIEGLTLDTTLSLTHRLTQADRSMLLTASDVLADMPTTAALYRSGALSWGQVRGIAADAKRLSKKQRVELDAWVAASVDLLEKMDPDDAVDAVRVTVEELRDRRAVERSERERVRGNFVWAQPGLFDRGKVYGELDNCSLAAVITGMDAAAPADDGRSLAQRRADGLVALAVHRCDLGECTNPTCTDCNAASGPGGPDADGTELGDAGVPAAVGSRCLRVPVVDRAVPAFNVLVDARDASVNVAGIVDVNVPGCLPTISAALAESLAADASVRAVVCDGARPLTVARKVWAQRLPGDVRLAVKVRDRGDRFPGSRLPIEHVHHFNKDGEGHSVDHVAGFSRRSHRWIHRHRWRVSLDPATAEMTFRRGDRTWVTLPRGTRLRRPPPSGEDRAG